MPDDLATPKVDVLETFGAEHVARAKRYERFHYANWALAQLALLITLALYAWRGAAFASESSAGPIGTGMLLGMLGLGLAWLVGVPFRLAAHWWERRHDLTELGYLAWIVDDWAVLGAQFLAISLALVVVMGLARRLGERWWLPGAAAFVAIAAALTFVAPYLDLETKPLRDRELASADERYRRELGLETIPLRVLEVSDDTRRANAHAYGIGPSRRVVLWDTILREPFDEREQRVLLAHELAHHARDHLLEGIGWFALFAVPGSWILMRATRRRGGMGDPRAVPLALLLVVCLALVSAPAANLVSRRMEAEADWTALALTRDPAGLERLMVGVSRTSLADPTPPAWVQLLTGTHPSLAARVSLARAWAAREGPPMTKRSRLR